MEMILLHTQRLQLRALTPEVYRYAFTTFDKEALMEFFGCQSEEELEEERTKFDEGLSMYRKSLLLFQLMEKNSRTIIGWCGFHTWYLKHFRAELGYVMTDDAQKQKGFMKEALPVVLEYGFEKMGLERIEALIAPDNLPSLKLAAAHGFVQEGHLREHYYINGRFEDSLVFSLLKREFIKR